MSAKTSKKTARETQPTTTPEVTGREKSEPRLVTVSLTHEELACVLGTLESWANDEQGEAYDAFEKLEKAAQDARIFEDPKVGALYDEAAS